MQSESVTKRSHCYDVWFAEERTWTASVTCQAPAELYPGEKGHFRFLTACRKILCLAEKCGTFPEKSGFTTNYDKWSCPTSPPEGVFRRILRKKYRRAVRTHHGPTWIQQARYSLSHGRDCSAGTTILQLVSASDDRTKALISDYGSVRAAGARATLQHPPGPQDRSTGLRAGGSREQPPPNCRISDPDTQYMHVYLHV